MFRKWSIPWLLLPLLAGCRSLPVVNPVFLGEAWGSGYSVTVAGSVPRRESRTLARCIDGELETIASELSLWNPDSELSRFNAWKSTNRFPLTPSLAATFRAALEISRETDGTFDPTIGPLMALWGFGPHGGDFAPPGEDAIADFLPRVGWRQISLFSNSVFKATPRIEMDLNAVADGIAADRISALLRAAGCPNHLVEVGGEVVAAGSGPGGVPWRIGIENPDPRSLPGDSIQGIVRLSDRALATSGNYRKERRGPDGQMYTHILDPRLGKPVQSQVASVSVVADSGIRADALATALFVMGPENGLEWIARHPGVEALFILRQPDGTTLEKPSRGFEAATTYKRVGTFFSAMPPDAPETD